MPKVAAFIRNWWVLTIAAAVVAGFLFGFALPIFWEQVRPMGVRILLVGMVLVVWLAGVAWRIFTRRQAAQAIEATLTAQIGMAEVDVTAGRMRDAIAKLKEVRAKGSNYLYDRPWYIIIGPPGAGKTTALLASGLQFPYSERALAGSGGTRNLDFWFADDAVFIDTAGRYTTQDSDQAKDAAGWRGFLSELKKRRPLHPANGVLIAFPSDKLSQVSLVELDAHAAAVRMRLLELRTQLEFELPVYVMFTKSDTLAGFSEHFADMDAEGRRAVLGDTFIAGPVAAAESDFAAAFDRVAQVIADRTARRLQDEPDQRRRAAILGYSSVFQAQRSRVVRFILGLASTDPGQRSGMVRGLYFTSGVQGGSAVDMMAAGLGVAAEARADGGASKGRAYFLNRLLREVVLAEPGMARPIDKAARRKRIAMLAGVGAIGALALALISGVVVSYFGNSGMLTNAAAYATAAEKKRNESSIGLAAFRPLDHSLESAVPFLDAMRALPGGYADSMAGYPPLNLGFGLYQSQVGEDASFAYRQAAARVILPRMFVRLREALIDEEAGGEALYQPLKVYLTLSGAAPAISRQVSAIRAWMVDDLAAQGIVGQSRERIMAHVDAMLDRPDDMFAVWNEGRAPYDTATVEAAQLKVRGVRLANRAIWLMKLLADGKGQQSWRPIFREETDVKAFQNPDAILALEAPYIFTKNGLEDFQAQLGTIIDEMKADYWVVGKAADDLREDELRTLPADVAARYADAYSEVWAKIRDEALKLPNLSGDPVATRLVRLKEPPPLVLLRQVAENTNLAKAEELDQAVQAALKQRELAGSATKVLIDRLPPGAGPEMRITDRFRDLHAFLEGGESAPAAEFFMALGRLAATPHTPGSGQSADAQVLQEIADRSGIDAAAVAATTAVREQQQGAATAEFSNLAERYRNEIYPTCRDITRSYPFQASGGEVTIDQALSAFGDQGFGGLIAELRGQLETSGVWKWRATAQGTDALGISPATLQRADEIRRSLTMRQAFTVSIAEPLAAGDSIVLKIGDTLGKVLTGNDRRAIEWPLQPDLTLLLKTAAGEEIELDQTSGDFALFKLIENGSSGPTRGNAVNVSFSSGSRRATLRIEYSGKNPFGRSGLWNFNCPGVR